MPRKRVCTIFCIKKKPSRSPIQSFPPMQSLTRGGKNSAMGDCVWTREDARGRTTTLSARGSSMDYALAFARSGKVPIKPLVWEFWVNLPRFLTNGTAANNFSTSAFCSLPWATAHQNFPAGVAPVRSNHYPLCSTLPLCPVADH